VCPSAFPHELGSSNAHAEIPADPKYPTFEPFRNYPTLSPAELPADLPPEYRRHLCTLLPYTASNASVSNLAIAHRDASGNLVHGSQVLNRPWEWVEYLGDNPAGDSRDEEKDKEEGCPMRHPVRNSGSLSLETFGARITGEGIIQNIACLDDVRVAGNLRTFEDGLSAESIYERDWRETRIELDNESSPSAGGRSRGEEEDELSPLTSFATARRATTSSHRPSPAPSVQSRGSAASRRQSPHTGSRRSTMTRSDGVEMDNGVASASNGTKRRSASAEDVEAGNEPHLPARQSKRGKTKTTTKTRAKKR
jgi:mediator of RNA polymerase II transcription subunit 12, fungi type